MKTSSKNKKRRQVKQACVNCQKAHACCSEERPCKRCVSLGIGDKCVDAVRKKRGRKKREDDEEIDTIDRNVKVEQDDEEEEELLHEEHSSMLDYKRMSGRKTNNSAALSSSVVQALQEDDEKTESDSDENYEEDSSDENKEEPKHSKAAKRKRKMAASSSTTKSTKKQKTVHSSALPSTSNPPQQSHTSTTSATSFPNISNNGKSSTSLSVSIKQEMSTRPTSAGNQSESSTDRSVEENELSYDNSYYYEDFALDKPSYSSIPDVNIINNTLWMKKETEQQASPPAPPSPPLPVDNDRIAELEETNKLLQAQISRLTEALQSKIEEASKLKEEKAQLEKKAADPSSVDQKFFDSIAFSYAYENTKLPMAMIASPDGDLLSANRSFCDMFGLEYTNFKSTKWGDILQQQFHKPSAPSYRVTLRCKNQKTGELIDASLHFDAAADNSGNVMFTLVSVISPNDTPSYFQPVQHTPSLPFSFPNASTIGRL